jgi:methyl-accepting chemotaxis protein
MRLSIKAKLAGGFGVMLVLAGLAGGVGYQRLVAADEAMRFVVERSEVQNRVLSAKALAIRAVSNTRATVISTSDEQMAQYAQRASDYRAEALADLDKVKPLLLTDEARQLFDAAIGKFDKQRALGSKVIELTRVNSAARTWAHLDAAGRPAMIALRADLEGMAAKAGTAASVDLLRTASAFQIRLERAWGQMQSATGAGTQVALAERVHAAKESRTDLASDLDTLIRVAAARGVAVDGLRRKFDA